MDRHETGSPKDEDARPGQVVTAERERLEHARAQWLRWGPYLSERAWGTVREDYSVDGSAWTYFPHDHARSRAYRWSEDGIAGLCDDRQSLCFALALWNGVDPILKERLFGVSGPEGNHGEDVKEYYFYLDATPTHSYMKMLYKYPQAPFPYGDLVSQSRSRSRAQPEYELVDTGVFDQQRYFDVFIEFAKAAPQDVGIRIRAINRGPDPAPLHLLPTLWFRNTWSWSGNAEDASAARPQLARVEGKAPQLRADHSELGRYWLVCGTAVIEADGKPSKTPPSEPTLLFTENETNAERLFGSKSSSPYVKDAFHRLLIGGENAAVNPDGRGTKAAAHYSVMVPPGAAVTVRLRLASGGQSLEAIDSRQLDDLFARRIGEANDFYAALQPDSLSDDERNVQRQAFAGMLWTKQLYIYDLRRWLDGDPIAPPPPERRTGRNHDWRHVDSKDILSMPDKWEYPWFAAWDLAFHCLPLAILDPELAKSQLILLGREWFQHPNGQVPAYEWEFGDTNPPVLAWAALRVYQIERRRYGRADRGFLERVFHKMMLNFTWWVNRKDAAGKNVFSGGFLGLDNIGVFDRSAPLPGGGQLEQTDATSWMGMFSLDMMAIALELARENPAYEDIATKFFEHFLSIAAAMHDIAGEGISLWDDEDEFFYDVLRTDGRNVPMRIQSIVGLIPLFAVMTVEPSLLAALPGFRERLEWLLVHRPDLASLVSRWHEPGIGERRLVAILRGHRMKRVLRRMLDEEQYLAAHGVRSLSRRHGAQPFQYSSDGREYRVDYEPGESSTPMFGGNSNWRGPIWFPINYLIVESLQKFHHYYGHDFRVEAPTGSGTMKSLGEIADDLSMRLIGIFLRDQNGRRPVFGDCRLFQEDEHWRDLIPFYEYFHGETAQGLGASHQTGWTGLVAKLIQQQGERRAGGDILQP